MLALTMNVASSARKATTIAMAAIAIQLA